MIKIFLNNTFLIISKIPSLIAFAIFFWNFFVRKLFFSSLAFDKNAVSTNIEGISGDFKTTKPACPIFFK